MKRSQALLLASCLMVLSFFGTLVYANCFSGFWSEGGDRGVCYQKDGVPTHIGYPEAPINHFADGYDYAWEAYPLWIGFKPWVANGLPNNWYYEWFVNQTQQEVENGAQWIIDYQPDDGPHGQLNLWEILGRNESLCGNTFYVQVYQADNNNETVNHCLWKVFLWKPGDANFDLEVDEDDQAILSANWNQSGKSWQHGDFDGNGTVSLNDLQIMATYWGT